MLIILLNIYIIKFMEVSKIAKNIEEEGVNYISTSLDLLDIVAEYLELDVEEISAEDLKDVVLAKFEVIDILTKEIDILTEDQEILTKELSIVDIAMQDVLPVKYTLSIACRIAELKAESEEE